MYIVTTVHGISGGWVAVVHVSWLLHNNSIECCYLLLMYTSVETGSDQLANLSQMDHFSLGHMDHWVFHTKPDSPV